MTKTEKKTKTQVLTHKIEIVKPISTKWEIYNKIAGNIIYTAIKIMNDAIEMQKLHDNESYRLKQETGEYIDAKSVYGVLYSTVINRTLKERYAEAQLPGDLLEALVRAALSAYKINAKEAKKGNAKLLTFRRDQPIPIRGRSLRLTEDYTVSLPMMSSGIADKNGFTGVGKQSFEVQLKTSGRKSSSAKLILDRILSGEYKIADSKVQRTLEGKWFLLLSYHKPIKEIVMDKNKVMGIDLGIVNAATIAIDGERWVHNIAGGEITAFRRRIEGRRKSMRNQLRVCSENRRGHGRKTLLRPLEVISSKVENFKNTVNHRYSKYIVDLAVKNGVGVIQMEDLSNVSKNNSFLATWSYYDLQEKIKYKAKGYGIEFVRVKPEYTSQRCNKCGVIDKENRKTQERFSCTTCGHSENADYNAARNIAMRDIDKIIEEQLKIQKAEEKKLKKIKEKSRNVA